MTIKGFLQNMYYTSFKERLKFNMNNATGSRFSYLLPVLFIYDIFFCSYLRIMSLRVLFVKLAR